MKPRSLSLQCIAMYCTVLDKKMSSSRRDKIRPGGGETALMELIDALP